MIMLSSYDIIAEIHKSVKSVVYRGRRNWDNLPVVLKVLKEDYPTPEERTRYKQEYEIARNLNLEGVVRAYDLHNYQNTLVMSVEDFGGESLKILMEHKKLTLSEFLPLAIQIVENLGLLHQQNIIHKDINPSNIVFNPETGQVKIIDFGIATVLTRENPTIKSPNVLEGTLAYMSPEQTGRMNRSLDYRTDFYSLGVTFYEMLTGQLPFSAADAMELVHCHIAKQPVPPHLLCRGTEEQGSSVAEEQGSSVAEEIPKAVSDIVMKLLAKTAEERYQSTWGIQVDLVLCLMQLEANGSIEDIIPGDHDVSDKFQIPQKLYGREREIETLLTAFERVSQGKSEMMLVSGYSGIGKTSLVQEIYKPITWQRGYFISGKFDQFQRNIPYSAVVSAFSDLVRQLLTESSEQLNQWRKKLLGALGANAQVIIDVIPEVELIVGKQPAVTALAPAECQNRLKLVFQNFIRVFTSPSHPLVIFLDDLQWTDAASLKLLELLMTAPEPGLFLMGAYRDNEVGAAHPLMLTLDEIQKAGAVVNHISLSPLALSHINLLISETLNCAPEKTRSLAELVLARTQGNPFFINEFFKTLYADKLLEFNFSRSIWEWSIEQIQARGITDNVVELMAGKIQKLSENTQRVLQLAACIGNEFDIRILAIALEKSTSEAAAELFELIGEGLVLPLGNIGDWGLMTGDWEIASPVFPEYKFAHDRIQQAAYSLISEQDKQAVHWQVGQLLLQNTPPNKREQKIFDIVNKLNFGISLITHQESRDEIAQLNLIAGQKALASAAYEPAFNYLKVGIGLLGEDSWQQQYDLTLALYIEAASAASLRGNIDEMERLAEVVLQQARSLLDTVKVYEVKISACIAQNKLLEAVKTALTFLKLLGVGLPELPSKLDILLGLVGTKLALRGKEPSNLIDLPEMTDPYKKAAMRILSSISGAAFIAVPELLPLIAFKMIGLSVKYGSAPQCAHAYATYGVILCGMGDIEAGFQFSLLALSLVERFNANSLKAKTFLWVNACARHWKEHVKETLKPLQDGYCSGLETGDLECGAYCAFVYSYYSYFIGSELAGLEREMATYSNAIFQLGQTTAFNYNNIYRQAVLNLMGKDVRATRRDHLPTQAEASGSPLQSTCRLIGDSYDESKMLPLHIEANDRTALFHLYLNKLLLCYMFQEYHQAIENAAIAEKYLDGITGALPIPIFHFYDSLASLAVFPHAQKPEQKRILVKVTANQKKMQKWAHHAPMNHLHKFYLVSAERHRVLGQYAEAMDLYDRAIEQARENDYINEEALAHELAAKFYLAKGNPKIASVYMQDARYCYLQWGATAKVKDLDTRYPELLARKSEATTTGNITTKPSTLSTTSTTGSVSEALDLTTVMKASQAIAGEIVLDKLLAKLMKILIENAGAQSGFLILPTEGKLLISASASVEQEAIALQQSTPVESRQDLPVTVINYVHRTRSDVVLSNAAREGQFTTDPYIAQRQVKSVLCTPIINQGQLIAILYLENNLTAGAFTPDRLEVLRLLSSQAAISLENALLYASVEQKVQDRTLELNEKNVRLEQTLHSLQRTQAQLIQTEKMSSLGQMVAGVAHEINNPVSFIYGNLTHAGDYVQELLKLIDVYRQEYPNPTPLIQETTEDIDLEFLVKDVQKLLASMKGGAERIRNIVLSLRNFSRLDEADMKPVDIREGIESTLLILQHRLRETAGGPPIEVIQEYGQLPQVTCYASQLNQVFMNILSNAIDAVEEQRRPSPQALSQGERGVSAGAQGRRGAGDIRIRTEVIDGDRVLIRIKDNGPGMTSDVQKRVFDPFFTTKPVGSGTGLGLSISYQIVVEKHGGQLSCVSAPGLGTEFAIAIPIKPM